MTITVWTITGYPVYDFFFTIVMFSGLVAVVPAQIFKLFR